MTTPLAARIVADVLGVDLHPGSVVVDVKGGEHTIDRLAPYPGRYIGDSARVAYDVTGVWRCTVGDHEHFHTLPDEESTDDTEVR